MTDVPFISVVMPCHDVERYVTASLNSVAAQTVDEWEIVAIDDCSNDCTQTILRAAAQRDERIRVFALPENLGAAAARNYGLSQVRGTHVAFLDPDDSFDPSLFETLRRIVTDVDPQMVVWGAREEYTDETGAVVLTKDVVAESRHCDTPESVHATILDLERLTLFGYVWNKLYRRDLLEKSGPVFPSTAINEDVFFNITVARSLRSLTVVGSALYSYARRDAKRRTSLTARFLPDYFELSSRRVGDMLDLYRAWGEVDAEVKKVLGTIYVRCALSALQRNCDPRANMKRKARKDWLGAFYDLPLSRELVEYAAPEGRAARIFAWLFQHKSKTMLLLAAHSVYVINAKMPAVFSRLKQSR